VERSSHFRSNQGQTLVVWTRPRRRSEDRARELLRMPAARSRRPPAAALARRWLAVLLIGMIGYAYYHPLRSWLETRSELHARAGEVGQLAAQKRELQQRVHASETLDSVARQARQLGYIRPGEHLFIVKGIKGWQKAHSRIDGGGH
jgi:cell division protein FtsB